MFLIICLFQNIATVLGFRKTRTGPATSFSPAVGASLFDFPVGKNTPVLRASDCSRSEFANSIRSLNEKAPSRFKGQKQV